MKIKQKRVNRVTETDLADIYALVNTHTFTTNPENRFDLSYDLLACKTILLKECENIVLRELRHIGEETYYWYTEKFSDYSDAEVDQKILEPFSLKCRNKIDKILVNTYGDESREVNSPYFTKFMTFETFSKKIGIEFDWNLCCSLFDLQWNSGFGGSHWKNFANSCQLLENCSSETLWFRIDRTINMIHNNGNFTSKFYYGDEIKKMATYITKAKSPASVFDKANGYVSRKCKKMLYKEGITFHQF